MLQTLSVSAGVVRLLSSASLFSFFAVDLLNPNLLHLLNCQLLSSFSCNFNCLDYKTPVSTHSGALSVFLLYNWKPSVLQSSSPYFKISEEKIRGRGSSAVHNLAFPPPNNYLTFGDVTGIVSLFPNTYSLWTCLTFARMSHPLTLHGVLRLRGAFCEERIQDVGTGL